VFVAGVRSSRSAGLDRLRGLAVALMLVDHVLLLSSAPDWTRLNVTRLAMPLFFVIGGHLVRRFAWARWAGVLLAGFAVEAFAPWSGAGVLLLCFVVGAVYVVSCRGRARTALLCVPVVASLVLYANGLAPAGGGQYAPVALVGFMCAGALLSRSRFEAGARLPAVLGLLGRYPLSLYVGHLLVFQAVAVSV
jgi:uncharacterized membrane protein